jgi:hypothetical protein
MEAGVTVARQFGENFRAVRCQAGLSQERSAFAPPFIELRSGCWSGASRAANRRAGQARLGLSASGSTVPAGGHHLEPGEHPPRDVQALAAAELMPRKRRPASHYQSNQPVSKSSSKETPKATRSDRGARSSKGDVQRRLLQAPTHHHPTARHTGNPPGSCLERALSPGGVAADFGTASAVRRPPLWPPDGLAGTVDFESDPMHLALFSRQVGCRRNARRGSHRDRTAVVAGGRCPRLRAVAARGLPSDCAGRVACGAALQPAPHPSGRVGAMDRGRVVWGEFDVEPPARRAACASCSMRARKAR